MQGLASVVGVLHLIIFCKIHCCLLPTLHGLREHLQVSSMLDGMEGDCTHLDDNYTLELIRYSTADKGVHTQSHAITCTRHGCAHAITCKRHGCAHAITCNHMHETWVCTCNHMHATTSPQDCRSLASTTISLDS